MLHLNWDKDKNEQVTDIFYLSDIPLKRLSRQYNKNSKMVVIPGFNKFYLQLMHEHASIKRN